MVKKIPSLDRIKWWSTTFSIKGRYFIIKEHNPDLFETPAPTKITPEDLESLVMEEIKKRGLNHFAEIMDGFLDDPREVMFDPKLDALFNKFIHIMDEPQ